MFWIRQDGERPAVESRVSNKHNRRKGTLAFGNEDMVMGVSYVLVFCAEFPGLRDPRQMNRVVGIGAAPKTGGEGGDESGGGNGVPFH